MRDMWKFGGIWLATLALAAGGLAEKPHPRLWLPKSSEAALREKLARDPLAAKLQAVTMDEAERVLKKRTCRYEIPDGKRLLLESRIALHNIMHCGWAWRMGGGEKFRLRAIAELEAACALKDWNPPHFLDTAEMASAVATGYDWLYDTLTPEQRAMCERAIIEKALKPAKAVYDKGGWWSNPRNNWSQVCGSGIALAAAAVAGKDAGLAEDLFARGLKLVESCGKFYEPDGMYPEGPGYWHYGTNFHVMLLAACQTLEKPITDNAILKKSGDAVMQLTGPTRIAFNFADGGSRLETPSPAQCWLASHFKAADQARYVRGLFSRALADDGEITGDRYFPLAVLWLPEPPAVKKTLPTAAVFGGEQAIAIFRTGWDANAAFFAIKGGTPAASQATWTWAHSSMMPTASAGFTISGVKTTTCRATSAASDGPISGSRTVRTTLLKSTENSKTPTRNPARWPAPARLRRHSTSPTPTPEPRKKSCAVRGSTPLPEPCGSRIKSRNPPARSSGGPSPTLRPRFKATKSF